MGKGRGPEGVGESAGGDGSLVRVNERSAAHEPRGEQVRTLAMAKRGEASHGQERRPSAARRVAGQS
jgi:hypothetical protein